MFSIIARLEEMKEPSEVDIKLSILEKLLLERNKRKALERGEKMKQEFREKAKLRVQKSLAEADRLEDLIAEKSIEAFKSNDIEEQKRLDEEIVEMIAEAARLRAFP